MQDIAKAEQPLRAAGADQRAMENTMTNDPEFVVNTGIVGITIGYGAQGIPCRFDVCQPRCIAVFDGSPQCKAFDIDPGLRDIGKIGPRNRADAKAPLVRSLHQAIGNQTRQSLPHRGEADGELLGEACDMQLLPGQQPGGQNIGAKPLLYRRGQASRTVEVGSETQIHATHPTSMGLAFAVVNRKSILLSIIVSFKGIALYRDADSTG